MITLNDEPYDCEDNTSIQAIIEDKKFSYPNILVALNGLVVEQFLWREKKVKNGDKLVIVDLHHGG